jgi:hypothetical protein
VQSVPITAKVVSSSPAHGEMYSIQHYVIKFVSDLRQAVVFSGYFRQLGSVFLIFLVFGIVFFDLFVFVLCPLPNIASVSVLSIPHYPFSLWVRVKVRAMLFKPLSTIFQLYRGGQFCWRKYPAEN